MLSHKGVNIHLKAPLLVVFDLAAGVRLYSQI